MDGAYPRESSFANERLARSLGAEVIKWRRKESISMSSTQSTPSKHLYILWARDLTDAECWSRRQAASPEHLDNVNTNWEPGFMRVAGVTVPPEYEHLPFQQKQWNGSMLILCAESLDAAWAVVKGDAFYRHNVWDKDSIVLMPFLPVTPIPDHAPLVLPGQQ